MDKRLYEHEGPDYTVRITRYAPHTHMPRHAHDEHGISVILDGSLVEEAEHRTVVASSGWVVNKPRSVYHENRFSERGAVILGIAPRDDLADVLPTRWKWAERTTTLRAAIGLLRDKPTSHDRMMELVATLGDVRACPSAPWLRRVKQALDDSMAGSVSELAAAAGVHPVYLARAFRASYGLSIREYRQMLQFRRALRTIVGTRLPLAQVALDCGFADHSHMCRTFRIVGGLNPAVLRG